MSPYCNCFVRGPKIARQVGSKIANLHQLKIVLCSLNYLRNMTLKINKKNPVK